MRVVAIIRNRNFYSFAHPGKFTKFSNLSFERLQFHTPQKLRNIHLLFTFQLYVG